MITIFTDGAAKGNPGPGGYGAVVWDGEQVYELGEAKDPTTNNETELRAAVEALKSIKSDNNEVTIYTDSKYVVEGASGWIFGWMKNGWKTKANEDVQHKGIWQELIKEINRQKVSWIKVPGHVGLIGNERADTIASDLGEKKEVDLYMGSKAEYPLEIENVEWDKEAAAKRSAARKRSREKAYSYISKVDGEVKTHETWKECEDRVKGKSGVRYKKSISASEEKEIIADFS